MLDWCVQGLKTVLLLWRRVRKEEANLQPEIIPLKDHPHKEELAVFRFFGWGTEQLQKPPHLEWHREWAVSTWVNSTRSKRRGERERPIFILCNRFKEGGTITYIQYTTKGSKAIVATCVLYYILKKHACQLDVFFRVPPPPYWPISAAAAPLFFCMSCLWKASRREDIWVWSEWEGERCSSISDREERDPSLILALLPPPPRIWDLWVRSIDPTPANGNMEEWGDLPPRLGWQCVYCTTHTLRNTGRLPTWQL